LLTILAVGEDFDLLRTRAEILSKTGANVLCSTGAAALKFIAEWEFDLVVLGHSVSQQNAQRISEAAHRKGSKTLVLLLVLDRLQEQAYDGINLDARSFVEPGCLIRNTFALLERQRSPHSPPSALKVPANQFLAKKKPETYPADISVRRAQISQFKDRKVG
jgi:hypothetical protein